MEETLNDEELVDLFNKGDPKAEIILFNKYSVCIRSWIMEFQNVIGKDIDLLWINGLIAYYGCLKSFNNSKGIFYSYCKVCCKRAMLNELKKMQNRLKYEKLLPDDEMNGYYNLCENSDEFIYDIGTYVSNITDSKVKLNEEETTILRLRADGLSYKEIADKLNISLKKIDNTIQYIKRKCKDKNIK